MKTVRYALWIILSMVALVLLGIYLDRSWLRPEQTIHIIDQLEISQPVDTLSIVSMANSGLVVLTQDEYWDLFDIDAGEPITPYEPAPGDSGIAVVSFDTSATVAVDSSEWQLEADIGIHIDVLLSDPPVANIDVVLKGASLRYNSQPITFDPSPIPLIDAESTNKKKYTGRQMVLSAVAGSVATIALIKLAVTIVKGV